MHLLAVALVLVSSAWIVLGAASVAVVTRRKRPGSPATPPAVSVLKPLCGADAALAESLESFFVQDHPSYELLFGVEDEQDLAVPVARALMARYPDRAAKLVVHTVRSGVNPKVRNLRGMIEHARHDLVVVSDSNVRVPSHYLSELCAEHAAGERVGLVTNLVRGAGEQGVGSVLESVQLAGFCAAGVAGPTLVGEALVMGKSMLFSRRVLESLGGLGSVANVLAEDYVMGKMFQHAGYSVRIATTVVDNVITGATLRSFAGRSRRWAMLRFRLRPLAYAVEPLTSPLAMLPVAFAALGAWALPWALVLLGLRDVVQWTLLSGPRRAWLAVVLSPLREAIALVVWARAPLHRHLSWRGTRVRLSSGSVAYATPDGRRGVQI